MKNIQIIDGAENATFSVFQASEEEFLEIFPEPGQDMEVIEDFSDRVTDEKAASVLHAIWNRPILKRDVAGIHGTLFFDYAGRRQYLPDTKREIDWAASCINEAQRLLFASRK
ncbi:hypothetical protein J2X76_004034 [Neorhizobium sp. 2083]|uniref:hypothetical protein n=1 Tax=Neorhizobium sp. 2083 TaxID=2817762 RepID=UPI0028622BDB|nr:hypothetical protein [Neorhizobium sp. 2083]MDR6818852.1 hypothetical protein [Neorhizobium sp. 2083]